MKFKKEFLINELDLPYSAIEDIISDTDRWSEIHTIIFEHPRGVFYTTKYKCGSTELQSEGPWEYADEIDCVEVELKEVLVKKWVAKGITK